MAHVVHAVVTSSSRPPRRLAYRIASLLTVCVLVTAPACWAQQKPTDACETAENQNDRSRCAADAADKANAELIVVLAKARKAMIAVDKEFESKLNPDPISAAKALELSQRGWLQYREGRCVVAGFAEHGGSMEPMVVSECVETATRARIAELTQLAGE